MGSRIQRSVLHFLRADKGKSQTVEWLARKVFDANEPTRAHTVSVRRALGTLSGEPYLLIERRAPLRVGGKAKWRIRGVAPPPLVPRPPKGTEQRAQHYVPTGLPTHRDEELVWYEARAGTTVKATTLDLPLRGGSVNQPRGGILWDRIG